jgi:Uma2 family endonuclease
MTETLPLAADRRVRLRVEDYELLSAHGAFAGVGRTELLDGVVVAMNPQYRPHLWTKTELYDLIRDALRASGSQLRAMSEGSVIIGGADMPQPDILVTSEPRGEGPVPVASVALMVEVADSSLEIDLGYKAALYASAGIPDYWVADIAARVIHVHAMPEGERYLTRTTVAFGAAVTSPALGLTIETMTL